MFEAKRAYATAIYLAMMVRADWTSGREPRARAKPRAPTQVITLVLAFHGANKGLVLMCCVLQWCAAVWCDATLPSPPAVPARLREADRN